jgi:uncharacterized protein (TIGR00162 family)
MEEVEVVTLKQVRLRNPVLVEGLPGIGQVGKLVADHLVAELKAEKVMEIYSPHFPPQVIVQPDGSVRLFKNEVYAWRRPNGKARGPGDLLIIAGDQQSTTNVGYYRLASAFVEIAAQFGVKRIYTIGGYGVGKLNSKPAVVGAVSDPRLVEEMRRVGVEFRQRELGSGIVGASGLVLGLAARRSIEAACLLGVTSGYMADPRSAQAVLRVLSQVLDLQIDFRALDARAKEVEGLLSRLKEMERGEGGDLPREEELRYIG